MGAEAAGECDRCGTTEAGVSADDICNIIMCSVVGLIMLIAAVSIFYDLVWKDR